MNAFITEHYDFITQAFGWLAAILGMLKYQLKTARHFRIGNVFSTGTFVIHYSFLGAWTAFGLSIVAVLRSASLLSPRLWMFKKYIAISSVIICTIIWALTSKNWYDVLPLCGLYFGAIIDIQDKAILARFFSVFSQSAWLVFHILSGSQGGAVNNSVNITSNLIGFWRHQLRPYLKTGDKKHFKI